MVLWQGIATVMTNGRGAVSTTAGANFRPCTGGLGPDRPRWPEKN